MFAIVVPCPLTWHRGRSLVGPCPLTWHRGRSLVGPCPLTWHRGRSLAVSAKVFVEAGALTKRNVAVIHRPPGALPPFQTFALTARCERAPLPRASLPTVACPWAMDKPAFVGLGMAFSHPHLRSENDEVSSSARRYNIKSTSVGIQWPLARTMQRVGIVAQCIVHMSVGESG